jgi:signal transduction histidine kinase/ActR/RegA family two-component response regulator
MFPKSSPLTSELPPALDPERILKRDFFYHLPSVALVVLVVWPLVSPAAALIWAGLLLGLVKLEHAWTGRDHGASRWNWAVSFALTFAISFFYAFAAAVLITRQSSSASLFGFVLLTSSIVSVLLRYFHRPVAFVFAVLPQAALLALVGVDLVHRHLSQGKSMEALSPAATLLLFVLLFWAARDQLAKMHRGLVHATASAFERERAAQAASQAKSAFLATVSHEIRTPLNGVLGMAQAMTLDKLAENQRERVQIIRRCGESLLAIVDDVLDLSKIEAGKLVLEQIPFDLDETARGAAETFSGLAQAKGLAFDFIVDAAAQGRYLGDPTRLRQVMHNLISNAVKFTHAGRVGVRVALQGDRLALVVSDTGIGIPAENRSKLFDKFVQADASTTRQFGGSGLGLAIARELVNAMGGDIAVQSTVGKGSTFTATFALDRLPDAPAVTASRADVAVDGDLKVLAAEDNAVNQQVLKAVLAQAGVIPVIVGNGSEALEAWEAGHWDIVLMDIQMPEMDGVAAARAIRAREAATGRSRTPILALTANAMHHQALEYRAAGMDGLAAKPIDIVKLFEAMDLAMRGQGSGWGDVAQAS